MPETICTVSFMSMSLCFRSVSIYSQQPYEIILLYPFADKKFGHWQVKQHFQDNKASK